MKKTSRFIQRKTLIYKTNVEYGDYTINHVQGCSHGCKYPCYAFMMKKRFGLVTSYEDWVNPSIVDNALDLLDKEIPRYKNKIRMMHLCFTTDPFMYGYNDIKILSLEVIRKFNNAGINCSVLTKGVLPHELMEFSKNNEYGITIVSLDEQYREHIEPGAAPYVERLSALRKLHDFGLKTWVSIEPYPTPNIITQDLSKILDAVKFTDKIIFGRTNYSKLISAYKPHKQFYNEQAALVIAFCKKHNIEYHIKYGTIT